MVTGGGFGAWRGERLWRLRHGPGGNEAEAAAPDVRPRGFLGPWRQSLQRHGRRWCLLDAARRRRGVVVDDHGDGAAG